MYLGVPVKIGLEISWVNQRQVGRIIGADGDPAARGRAEKHGGGGDAGAICGDAGGVAERGVAEAEGKVDGEMDGDVVLGEGGRWADVREYQ